jgi:hypothetical protein
MTSAKPSVQRKNALMVSSDTSYAISSGRCGVVGRSWASSTARQPLMFKKLAVLSTIAIVAIVLFPHAAYAWTPGTHVFLGEAVLKSLAQLPSGIADLLRAFPFDFLYGSIAADTSIAKKYVPTGRHCHSWNVGMEIHDAAPDEPMKAFGLGYLSHLAADAIAHNYFVPKQLALTASTSGLGHSYWESRFETHLGPACARQARDLILLDHSRADGLLDRILSPTIFSTATNRRIFRGMVHAADNEGWQRIFSLMMENSRWDLADREVAKYVLFSYDYIMDLLVHFDHSSPYKLDPAGDEALRKAKRVRREALRSGGAELVNAEAERHFGLPSDALGYAEKLSAPLYVPSRALSN